MGAGSGEQGAATAFGIAAAASHMRYTFGMRSIRRFSQLILTLIGGGIVIYAMFRVDAVQNRVLLAALGLLVMELGIWQVTQALFPNEREYKPLRNETDYFLNLVRRMNAAAVKGESEPEIDQLMSEMYTSVDRMRRLAGQTEEELGLATAPEPKRSMLAAAFSRRSAKEVSR